MWRKNAEEAVGSVFGDGYNRPIGVPVDQHEVCDVAMVEVVGAYVLEGILRVSRCSGWHGWLGGGVLIACGALGACSGYVLGDAGPTSGLGQTCCLSPGGPRVGR